LCRPIIDSKIGQHAGVTLVDYEKDVTIKSDSGRKLVSLKDLGIKKEYVTEIVLPFLREQMNDPEFEYRTETIKREKDIVLKDSTGLFYKRSVQVSIDVDGYVELHSYSAKFSPMLISKYTIAVDNNKITGITENKQITDASSKQKHVSVAFAVYGRDADGSAKPNSCKPLSVLISEVYSNGLVGKSKYYFSHGLEVDDILEEGSQPANYVQIITLLRSDSKA